jgi:hypothetical protein
MSMYYKNYDTNLTELGLDERSRAILTGDFPLTQYEPIITEQVVTFRFSVGTMFWLDIISSITAGTAPFLQPLHFTVLTSSAQIKLEDIMGCRNWAMLQIGRIVALHKHMAQTMQEGRFNYLEIGETAADISKYIILGLSGDDSEGFEIHRLDF